MRRKTGLRTYGEGEREIPAEWSSGSFRYVFEHYWEGSFWLQECVDGLLYALAIERRLLIAAVHINNGRRESPGLVI